MAKKSKTKRIALKISDLLHDHNIDSEDGAVAMLMLSATALAAIEGDRDGWVEWFGQTLDDAIEVRKTLSGLKRRSRLRVVK